MKRKDQNKGITLVALVITIIVLLILAGVAINMAINSDGLFTKANEASQRWNESVKEESQTIDNLLLEMGIINWEKSMAEAVAPASQDEERNNGVVGIGTDGKPVDMDLWLYAMDSKTGGYGLNSAEVLNNEENGGTGTTKVTMTGYLGTISENGEIQGKVPAYIKGTDGKWVAVTSLYKTFQGNATNNEQIANLTVAPVLPETVKNMMATFASSKITRMPEIPNKVTNMTSAFFGCTMLDSTTIVPKSVQTMDYAFYGCTSLKKTPQLSEGVTSMIQAFIGCTNLNEITNLPDSVIDMTRTFENCTSLQNVKKLPANVQSLESTFHTCTSLKSSPEIPNGVISMMATFSGCTSLEKGPQVIPSSVTNLYAAFNNCAKLEGTMEINAIIDESIIVQEWEEYDFTGSDRVFLNACAEGNGLTILKTSTIPTDIINKWTSSNSKVTLEQ